MFSPKHFPEGQSQAVRSRQHIGSRAHLCVDRFPQIQRTTLSKLSSTGAVPSGGYANPEKPYSGSSRECWHMYTLYRVALHRVPRRLCIMQLQMSGLASSPAQSKVKCVSVSLHLQVFYLAEYYVPNRRYLHSAWPIPDAF